LDVGLFDFTQNVLDSAMSGAMLRGDVLANNVANANTAGFKRSDVDFQSTLADAIDSGTPLDSVTFAPQQDSTTAMTADGNNVDVDTEMANISENSAEYNALAAVAKARLSMLQTVIGTK
jgi:flagellar basal-body rod protein FlgB